MCNTKAVLNSDIFRVGGGGIAILAQSIDRNFEKKNLGRRFCYFGEECPPGPLPEFISAQDSWMCSLWNALWKKTQPTIKYSIQLFQVFIKSLLFYDILEEEKGKGLRFWNIASATIIHLLKTMDVKTAICEFCEFYFFKLLLRSVCRIKPKRDLWCLVFISVPLLILS